MQVRLDLLVGDYVRNADRAGNATRSIADAAAEPRRALQGLQQVGAALGQTLTAAVGVGAAAAAGWTAAAVTAGVAYNSLQQTAGSALETLLGSAEAATAQMEELAAFASTSPFPRQLWIQAQQTLIGFGVEAEKIIPTFQALQDGVVAVGGSAQSIEEVVLILSKISSVGKVTAEDLNELGVRGIDAATLVGEAWGMTAAEVRDSMSEGAVDATQFLDTLVDQLGTKYSGAAEGLRTTWVGALDRIAGATRDIGSVIAEPFIDPQGGGAAVQWANDMADALRAFEDMLRPAVEVLSQRAEPAFQAASEAMQRFTESIRDVDIIAVLDSLESAAPILSAFGAAAAAAGSASVLSAVGMGGLAAAINPVVAGLLGLAAASPAFRDALMDLVSAVAPLIPALVDLGLQIGEGLTLAIDSLMPFVEVAIGLISGMVQVFTSLPEPIQTAAIAIGAFAFALKRLGPVGIILTGIGYIATAVASLTGSSDEASVSVNDLAEDLRNLQTLGKTFKIQETDFGAIAGPLREAADMLDATEEGLDGLTATGRQWVDVEGEIVAVTREYVDAHGNLTEIVRYGTRDSEKFTEAVDNLDLAMAELVGEGTDAEEVIGLVAEATGLSREEIAEILPLLDDYQAAADEQSAANQQAADEQDAFAEKVGASVAALQELADEMRAQVDPVFAAMRALQDYEDAQDAYNEAVDEHGEGSQEALDAEMALVDAYLTAAAAAGEMAKATGGDLPPELIAAAEAAGISEEGIKLLEDQFYATRDAGEVFGDDLANVNADLTTSTGMMAAQNALEIAGMDADYAAFTLNAKNSIDQLMDAGWTYSDAIAFVAQNSGRSTSEIEEGFGVARDAGLEFSDEYPAYIRIEGYQETLNRINAVKSLMASVDRTVTIAFDYTASGDWRQFIPQGSASVPFAFGGPVPGPVGAGDIVPAMLSPGEHVWTPEEVQAAGGHDAMEAMRAAVLAGQTGFAQSSPVVVHSTPVMGHGRGINVNNLNIAAINERLDMRQVRNELTYLAVS